MKLIFFKNRNVKNLDIVPEHFMLGPLRHIKLLGKYSIVKLNVFVGPVRPRRTQKSVKSGCRIQV